MDLITIHYTSLDVAFGAALAVDGQGDTDTVIYTGDSGLSFKALSITAETINLNDATISTSDFAGNDVTFDGAVRLGASVAIVTDNTTNDGGITFTSTVDVDDATTQDRGLTLTADTGTATFGGTIGVTEALADLDVTASTINLDGGAIQVDDDDAPAATVGLNGAVVLGSNATVDTDKATGADSSVDFGSTIDADNAAGQDRTLAVAAGTGSATFGGTIGVTEALADLDVTAATINLDGGAIQVDDDNAAAAIVGFNGAVVLGSNVTVDTDKAGGADSSVDFSATIRADDASSQDRTLTVITGTGTSATFGGTIGVTGELADFDVTAATINLDGGAIQVDDANSASATVSFNGAVVLGSNVSVDTDKAGGADSSVDFSSTIRADDAGGQDRTLTVITGTGTSATFGGTIGVTEELADFDVTAATIFLNGGAIQVDDDNAAAATVDFNGVVSLGNDVTLDTDKAIGTDSSVAFNSTVDADNAAVNDRTLTIFGGTGSVTFAANVGATSSPLADLDVTAGTINLNASTYQVDDQGGNTATFNGAVVLGTSVTVDTDGGADNNVTFSGTLNPTSAFTEDLVVSGGAITFSGAVGDFLTLGDVTLTDSTDVSLDNATFNAKSFTAISNITVLDSTATTLVTTGDANQTGGNVSVTASGAITTGAITALGGADGNSSGGNQGGTVTLNSTGSTVSAGSINTSGSAAAVSSNQNGGNAGTIDLDGTSVTLTGALTAIGGAFDGVAMDGTGSTVSFDDPVLLGGAVTIVTTGSTDGAITFGSTVNDAQTLGLTAGAANIDFNDIVGGVTPIGALTVNSAAQLTFAAAFTASSVTVNASGNVVINGALGTPDVTVVDDGSSNDALTGDIDITAGGIISGTGSIKTGDAEVDNSAGGEGTDTATSGSVTLQADGVVPVGIQLTGAIATGSATINNNSGNETADSGSIDLTATARDIGTSVGTPQAVAIGVAGGSSADTQGTVALTATGSDIFLTSAVAMIVSSITTSGAQDTVDIRVTGDSDLTFTGGLGLNDNFTAKAEGNLTLDTLDVGAAAAIDLQVDNDGDNDGMGGGGLTLFANSLTAQSITLAGGADDDDIIDVGSTTALGADLVFGATIILTADKTISTGAGTGTITFNADIVTDTDNTHTLFLTSGDITFNANVGENDGATANGLGELGGLDITDAGIVLFSGAGATIDVVQLDIGSNTAVTSVDFDGVARVDGAVDINTGALTLDATLDTANAGTVTVTNSGAADLNAKITSAGTVLFDGAGQINLSDDIQATDLGAGISVTGSVVQVTDGNRRLDTNVGPITLDEIADDLSNRTLTLDAGGAGALADITIDDNVASDTAELGSLVIEAADRVFFSSTNATVDVQALTIGSTTPVNDLEFDGALVVDGAVDIDTGTMTLDATLDTNTAGTVTVTNSLAVNLNAKITSAGTVLFDGAGQINLSDDIQATDLGAGISVTGSVVQVTDGNRRLDTNVGPITLDEIADDLSNRTLTLDAGGTGAAADVTIDDNVAMDGAELGSLVIETADQVTFSGAAATIDALLLTIGSTSAVNGATFDGVVSLDGPGTSTVDANDGVTINANFTTAAQLDIDADTGVADNDGTLDIADGVTVGTGVAALNITANDLQLNLTGMLSGGLTTIVDSDGTGIGLGLTAIPDGLNISGAELENITATGLTLQTPGGVTVHGITAANSANVSGTLTLDSAGLASFVMLASTFNALDVQSDDEIEVNVDITTVVGDLSLDGDANDGPDANGEDIDLTAGRILTSAGEIKLAATTGKVTAAGMLTLNAADGVTIEDDVTTGGQLDIDADTDAGDDDGTLAVFAGATVDTQGAALNITAEDVALLGSLDSGGSLTTIVDSDGDGIGLGATPAVNGLDISGAELENITSAGLTLQTAGGVTVNGITESNSDNVSGVVVLDAVSTVLFTGGGSTFNALDVQGDDGVDINANVTTDTGALTVSGDSDGAPAGADNVDIGDGVTLDAATVLTLLAMANGDITGAGTVVLNAADGMFINDNLTTSGQTDIDADTNMDSTGTLTLAAGVTVDTQGAALNITAADLSFGAGAGTTSGVADTTVTASSNVNIGVGDGAFPGIGATALIIPNAEVQAMSTSGELAIHNKATGGADEDIRLNDADASATNITLVAETVITDEDDAGSNLTTTGSATMLSGADIGGGAAFVDVDVPTLTVETTGGNDVFVRLAGTTNADPTVNLGTTAAIGSATVVLSTSNLTVGDIDANTATGVVTLDSVLGDINDGAAVAEVIDAFGLRMNAETGIVNLDTSVSLLAAETTQGDIQVSNSGALDITTVNSLSGVTITTAAGADNAINITALSPLTVSQDVVNNDDGASSITLTSTDDTGADDNLTIDARVLAAAGDGSVALNAGHDLIINDSGFDPDVQASGSGTVTAIAENSVQLNAGVQVDSSTGAISFTADNALGNNGATLFMNDTAEIDAGSATVGLSADGNVTLGRVTTINAGNTAVTITSTSGGIVDGGATFTDVSAGGRAGHRRGERRR